MEQGAQIALAPNIYHSPSPRESDVPSTGIIKIQLLAGIAASPGQAHFAAGWKPRRNSKVQKPPMQEEWGV